MLIDSNILVYAINSLSPKHIKAKAFLQSAQESLAVSHQNILESLRILTHPKFLNTMSVSKALKALNNITENLRIIYPNNGTYYVALELIKKYDLKSDLVFDAYLTATALSNDIDTIATDNVKDFSKITEITVINPFSGSY